MPIKSQQAFDALFFMLQQQCGKPEEMPFSSQVLYVFVKGEYSYTLVKSLTGKDAMIVVFSSLYSTAVSVDSLLDQDMLRARIVWDLLEQCSISEFGFNLLYKKGVPNQSALEGVDFADLRVR